MITTLRTMLKMEVRNEYGVMVNMPRRLESHNNIPIIDRISVVVLAHLLPVHRPYARIMSITPNSVNKITELPGK